MKTKLMIGIILVLTLLLLMPSIPAIQQKSVEDKAYSDFVELLKDFNFKDLKELKKIFEDGFFEHPIIYFLVYVASFRAVRGAVLILISASWDFYGEDITVFNPIIFIRAVWLLVTGGGFVYFLGVFAYIMGWELI